MGESDVTLAVIPMHGGLLGIRVAVGLAADRLCPMLGAKELESRFGNTVGVRDEPGVMYALTVQYTPPEGADGNTA